MLIGLVSLAVAGAAGTLAHHAIERLLHLASLIVREAQAAEHRFDNGVAEDQPVPEILSAAELRDLGDGLDLHVLESGGGELSAVVCRDPAAGRGGAEDPSGGR